MAHLRFKEGDLVEVAPRFRNDTWTYSHRSGESPMGPRVVGGPPPITPNSMPPDSVFLVLKETQESGWHLNKKLYVVILTPNGPRTAWASNFKMKKGKLVDISS